MNAYYPKYGFHPPTVRIFDSETMRFETTRRIPNSHLTKEEVATAVFEAVADSSVDLNDLPTKEELYMAVLECIQISMEAINSGD